MEKERQKIFSCPKCGTRVPVTNMFTLKNLVVCKKCKSKIKPKKQVISDWGGPCLGTVIVFSTYNILFYNGYGYWSLIFTALVGIITLIIVGVITYIKTEFEEY
jgi:predicted RNA-binding Zn-ribbon protein involved in translation (DUF1610 family)